MVQTVSLTAADVAAAAGGRLVEGNGSTPIGRVSIDSRTVAPGDLFVAIRGERFDGHDFLADAVARGALGAVVSRMPSIQPPRPLVMIQVADTTRALQDLARDVRRRSGTRVVAITGSAGKTTTKEVIADFLAARHQVFKNRGNLNNHIGLPLSLLELASGPEIAVVELGMNHPGEIRRLVEIAEPEVRVWTNVGDAHLGFFDSPDAVAEAKAEILEYARPTDVLVANADDERVLRHARGFTGRVMTFGIQAEADVRASAVEVLGLDGTRARVSTPSGVIDLEVPLLGLGNLMNVLAATAVAIDFGVPLETIRARTAGLTAAPRRGQLLRLAGGVTIIDDSYNSSPTALRRALDTLRVAGGCARKIAVLGEMLELGTHGARLHEACGRAAAEAGVDLLIAVGGPAAQRLAAAAVEAGLPSAQVWYVQSSEEAARLAQTRVRAGDLVLVKGSRGIRTDLVVDRLQAEFA